MSKLSICFISLNAYGMVSGKPGGYVGGAERQCAMLVDWFHKKGYNISVITWNEDNIGDEINNGIRIIKTCNPKSGLPGFKFFFPRWWNLLKAMNRVNADIYIHNCAEAQTGQAAIWCKLKGKKFFYFIASDMDCHRQLPDLKVFRERLLYRIGIKLAFTIVAQTKQQKIDLYNNFSLNSRVILMPCAGTKHVVSKKLYYKKKNNILWIGRICFVKRPDRLLKIASTLPNFTIDLVGPHAFDYYSKNLIEQFNKITNIRVHGRIEPNSVSIFYQKAKYLLCTSDFEGFPNTFLEAWSHGLPIISMFDPDSIIQRYKLGVYTNTVSGIISSIKDLNKNINLYEKLSVNAYNYYLKNHTLEVVLPQIESLLLKTIC